MDTNRDDSITPLDFLVVVNAIHVNERIVAEAAGEAAETNTFPDVNGDHFVTALDALVLANWFAESATDPFTDSSADSPVDLDPTEPGESNSPPAGSTPSDPDPADSDPADGSSSDSGSGSSELACDTPPVTVSAPNSMEEYKIFTISGTAKHAETIHIEATGHWAFVDKVGTTSGWSYDPETGAYSRMLIFKDDQQPGTAVDVETITVTATGPCAGTATAVIAVHNVDVQASVVVTPSEIYEGEFVRLTVNYSDAIRDGHKIVIDWGDGKTSAIEYPDLQPPPPPTRETIAFLQPPEPQTFSDSFTHFYVDDDPTNTPQDRYVVKITVTDNDLASTTVTTTVIVNNVAPSIMFPEIVPLDNVVVNGQIDETEGFRVTGSVTDAGWFDTHSGVVKADLNWDGDFEDAGEQIYISGSGWWDFDVTFSKVDDDGPSPGNTTHLDPLNVIITVSDDDTGRDSISLTTVVHNDVPKVLWDSVTMTFSRDELGNIDTVTLKGDFKDIGMSDKHLVSINWGDGGAGDGTTNPLPITGRSFSVTRRLPPSFGTSIRRILPTKLEVEDDDLGVDRGQLDGTTYWSFDAVEKQQGKYDLPAEWVQPFVSPSLIGAKWKGYGEAVIGEVPQDSNRVEGFAKTASALAYPGVISGPDFTKNVPFRATSKLEFSITCNRETGEVVREIRGGGGGNAILLDQDGNFLGWDPVNGSHMQYGMNGATTNIEIAIAPKIGSKDIEVSVGGEFGISASVTIVNEAGPQLEGPAGRVVIRRGATSTYPSGIHDRVGAKRTYVCRERLTLTKTDLEN